MENHAISEGIRVLGESISRKQTNVTSLTQAILEVKVETALLSEERITEDGHAGSGVLVPLLCALVVLLMTLLASIGVWQYRRRLQAAPAPPPHTASSSSAHLDLCSELEKSNNLQNEENLRRYTNPLKCKMDTAGGSDEGGGPAYRASCIKPDPGDAPSSTVMPRVSVVRPLSGDSTEMMELEVGDSPVLSPQHRHSRAGGISSQIFKAQSPDVRKNTSPPLTDTMCHKDFAKPLNLKKLPIQRTTGGHGSQQSDRQPPQDVLTVIV